MQAQYDCQVFRKASGIFHRLAYQWVDPKAYGNPSFALPLKAEMLTVFADI